MIAVRACLLTLGVELQDRLNKLTNSLRPLQKRFSALLADSDAPIDRLESLQQIWPQVLQCISESQKIGNRWTKAEMSARTCWLDPTLLELALKHDLEIVQMLQKKANVTGTFLLESDNK